MNWLLKNKNIYISKMQMKTIFQNHTGVLSLDDNSVMFYNQILNIEKFEQPESWYHIGPGNVTAGMVKKSISSTGIEIINSLDSLNTV